MQFLFPAFLIAAASIIIPILIHLFYFRKYKKIYFSNISLLRKVQETTSSRRKLREILILLARCFAVIFLVFAFAQPFFENSGKEKKGTGNNIIYIDNSFSMLLPGENNTLLDEAKQKALDIVHSIGSDQKVKIISNTANPGQKQWLSPKESEAEINTIESVPFSQKLSNLYKYVTTDFEKVKSTNNNFYLISDFQKNSTDLSNFNDSSVQVYILPLIPAQVSNLYIDTCYFIEPIQKAGAESKLVFKIINNGTKSAATKPILKINNNAKPIRSINIGAGKTLIDTIPVQVNKPGWMNAELSISDAPIQFDDNFFMSWFVPEKNNILVINDNSYNRLLDLALDASGLFSVNNFEYSRLSNISFNANDLIILNEIKNPSQTFIQKLNDYLQRGGNIFIFPSATGADIKSYSDAFQLHIDSHPSVANRTGGSINQFDPTFANVFSSNSHNLKLPATSLNYILNTKNSRGAIPLISYRDGSTFMARYSRNSGNIYLCAAPIDPKYNDLLQNGEILVPMLFKSAFAVRKVNSLSFIIGRNEAFQVAYKANEQDAILKFTGPQTYVPEQINRNGNAIINTGRETILAGVYSLVSRTGTLIGKYAFNYDRAESKLQYLSSDDYQNWVSPHVSLLDKKKQDSLAQVVTYNETGGELWKYCLIAALFFLLTEILLIRFLK